MSTDTRAYYVPVPDAEPGWEVFRPTSYCGGSWSPDLQHGAPPMGLLVRSLRRLWDTHADGKQAARLSFDFLGPIPMDEVRVRAATLRPGRRIDLSEAVMETRSGAWWRPVMVARAWRLARTDTSSISRLPEPARVSAPDRGEAIDMTALWPGGFVRSVEVVRDARFDSVWVRPLVGLVAGEQTGALERVFGVADFSNAFGDAAEPDAWTFMNVEMTAHLLDVPRGEWFNIDAHSFVGRDGTGVTRATLSDASGPAVLLTQELLLAGVERPAPVSVR
ncbi:thioesterase family protein [Nocardia sp. SYP-A9097]|uniref:thioesterase family protein n=1 Tax=Nocardia sp. SYP-A9097 TaxID=2663237 RepID=UPI00129A6593|nr:thioesterase family protein [Nocardia sp. SYP-A9097]MRH89629.1 thioesterase family protein [Nocardia sp. SYP-A9097]